MHIISILGHNEVRHCFLLYWTGSSSFLRVEGHSQRHLCTSWCSVLSSSHALRLAYFQLRPLWLITRSVRSLSSDSAKAVVQAFIMCRLDYCNSLLFGVVITIRPERCSTCYQELVTRSTSHQSCDSYIGSQSSSAWMPWNTNWPL